MVDKDEIRKKIEEEEDYIRCPKCGNSLSKFLAKNSEGVDDATIGRLLMIPEDRVQETYDKAVEKLQEEMVEDENDE